MKAATGCLIGLIFGVSASANPLLEGHVRLPSGAPVPGAQVRLFDLTDLRAAPLAATTDGSGHFTLPLTSLAGALPQGFELGANYPNPFNPSTMIPYQLPAAMHARLEVFNLLGQRVATLIDGEQPAGFHTARWDATDAGRQAVGAGVYIYRLVGGGQATSRRMLLIDGHAGIPSGRGGSPGSGGEAGQGGEAPPVYGLTVSGPGLVPYVDPDFRVEAGMAPLEVVIEAPGSAPSAKAASSDRILGDVDNTGAADFFDALLVALYSQDSSIVMPNNGDISLGDVDADGQVDLTDAWLIAAYLNDPSDPSLPAGIGEPVGAATASLSPDPSTVTFSDDGAWHRFTVEAGEPVTVVANPEGTTPSMEITTRSGRGNFCPAEAEDDVSRRDGQAVYLAGCAAGTATVELRRSSDGTVLNTYTFEVTGSPADLIVESVSVSDSTLTPGQSFTLRATVRNQGTAGAEATTLRWYRSTNATISTRDTEVGTDPVGALGSSRTSAESISLTAPSSEGTYYYGACVESVSGESNTGNNCSSVVTVTVTDDDGGDSNDDGEETGSGTSATSSVIPPPPSNAQYEWDSSTSRYRISWDPSPGAAFYEVYYDGATFFAPSCPGGCDLIGTVADTSFLHHSSATRRGYWVKACNDKGCSNYVRATYVRATGTTNRAPDLAAIGDQQVAEGGTLRLNLSASDADGDDLTFAVSGQPSGASLSGSTFTWTPTHDQAGTYRVTFTVSDGQGGSDQETLTITVTSEGETGSGTSTNTPPAAPANISFVRDGTSTRLTWDAVSGADYYKIYHDEFFDSGCRLTSSGSPSFCEELASRVTGTSYVHTNPDDDTNYYWVTACNSGGCSDIDSENPATFIDTRPGGPTNISFVRDGTSVRLSWDPVSGADYYKIYWDDFWSSGCSIDSRGDPSFCEELASNVQGTSYEHTSPDAGDNYYWVVACNSGGCSEIDNSTRIHARVSGGDGNR